MTYFIQTRKEKVMRGDNDGIIESNDHSQGDQKHWTNYKSGFATADGAAAAACKIIEDGSHKAENVRVCYVDMVFKAKTIVEQLKP